MTLRIKRNIARWFLRLRKHHFLTQSGCVSYWIKQDSPNLCSQSNALGQDTSNSDSIAVGDDYDFSFAGQGNGSPGSGNMITVDYISTNGDCIFACQNAAGTSFNTSVTHYLV
jgi:hypothetical protein